MDMLDMREVLERAKQVKIVIFDVDGVLTDGRLYLSDDGQESKAFYSRDGLGMKMLQHSGVEMAVITGRTSEVVKHRMASLGVEHVFQGRTEKLPAFEALCQQLQLEPRQTAYVGDDMIDLPVMIRAGLGIAVADAHPLVLKHAHWTTPHGGGLGAARDVCELVMQAQGTWEQYLRQYGL
jgi:3-deoxy-D-manno-octulosonate 8-phosphate phosphatase (KDO 8-P phosphatase)